jgi:hypothetical protein
MKRNLFSPLRNAETGAGGGASAETTSAAAETTSTPVDPVAAAAAGALVSGEAKTAEAPTTAAPEPLTFEGLKLPEGVTATAETLAPVLALFNDDKLSAADRVSALAGLHANLVAEAEAKQAEAWVARQTAAQNEIRNDPELGGNKLDASLAGWSAVLNEFGTSELRESLNVSGMGNNIHFARFLSKVAAVMSEGKPVVGAPTSGNAGKSAAELLYPTQGKV